ncbi:MAG: polyhydroxyalkanoate synthesis repressor PhaR, partial [Pseudomonadota bacterium]
MSKSKPSKPKPSPAPEPGAGPQGSEPSPAARDRSGPVSIKKYANRRLYNTGTSTYVTLDDLSRMVRRGEDFTVTDARSGDDITRSVLAQIIFEQESKGQADGPNLLPLSVMRQLIRFYGDSMQSMVPKYLEYSMDALDRDQDKFRALSEAMTGGLVKGTLPGAIPGALGQGTLTAIEERTRKNMEMFTSAMQVFNPFAVLQEQARAQTQAKGDTPEGPEPSQPAPEPPEDDLTA